MMVGLDDVGGVDWMIRGGCFNGGFYVVFSGWGFVFFVCWGVAVGFCVFLGFIFVFSCVQDRKSRGSSEVSRVIF